MPDQLGLLADTRWNPTKKEKKKKRGKITEYNTVTVKTTERKVYRFGVAQSFIKRKNFEQSHSRKVVESTREGKKKRRKNFLAVLLVVYEGIQAST